MYAVQRTDGELATMTLKAGFRTPHSAFRISHSAFCLLLLILGCGNAIEDALPTDRALTRLQQRCPWMDDSGIEDRIALTRIGMEAGLTKLEMLGAWGQVCLDDLELVEEELGLDAVDLVIWRGDCASCFLEMVEAVYP